jgi:hypothetical protein
LLTNKVDQSQLVLNGFLLGIELTPETDVRTVMKAVGDMLTNFPGVGTVDLEHLGEIEIVGDQTVVVTDSNPEDLEPMKES